MMCKENIYFYQMCEGLKGEERKSFINELHERGDIDEEIMDYLLSPACLKKDFYYHQMVEGLQYRITDEEKRELVREQYKNKEISRTLMDYLLGPKNHGVETIRRGENGNIFIELVFQNGKIVNEIFAGIDVGEAVKKEHFVCI